MSTLTNLWSFYRWLLLTVALALAPPLLALTAAPAVAGTCPVDDHGNEMATATKVLPNGTTPGVIDCPGDEDFFRIDLSSGGPGPALTERRRHLGAVG